MIRNWMFTLFYCSAELWGDIVLSLLFWGLANELTTMEEAPSLYPLFGIGANVSPLSPAAQDTNLATAFKRLHVLTSSTEAGCL